MSTIPVRKLGKTDLSLGTLTLGTWGLFSEAYGAVFPEQQTATVSRALDQGITSFDLAPTWGEHGSEATVASVVGTRRKELVYITRAGQRRQGDELVAAFGAEELREQCEASLGRLGTDYVDLMLLQHPPLEALAQGDVQRTMEALVQEGKLRAWGASVTFADDARAALVAGAQVLCVPFSMLQPEVVWDIASECRERGVGLLARSVLLHGLLAGRWNDQRRFTSDDHRMYRWSPEAFGARIRQAGGFRNRLQLVDKSALALALHFVLAHEEVASAIFGPRTPAQVVSATEALASEVKLDVSDLQFIFNTLQ